MSALVHHVRRGGAPVPLGRRARAEIEATIEHLIAMLDEIDGDPDLEPAYGLALRPGEQDEAEDENEHGTEIDRGEGDEALQIALWNAMVSRRGAS